MKTILGIDNFIQSKNLVKYKNLRFGLLSNLSSLNSSLIHSRFLIDKKFPKQLTCLFSPQHGFFADKQDNMIESVDILDPSLKIPIFSLYGKFRRPLKKQLDMIDALIVDLQDVGTRVYTYIYTLLYCMEEAKKYNKKIIVLDRPNPINGIDIEGNLLDMNFKSFVGEYPIPMRYGLTIGEIAKLFNEKINCNLEIIPMKNWNRAAYFDDTKLSWIFPSPNMPSLNSAMVYPGQVIFEGTNISEGRGTTLPFEIFGASFIDNLKLLKKLENKIKGIILRPLSFEPTSNKFSKTLCFGFQIHIINRNIYKPYKTSLNFLQAIISICKDFKWKEPPYEYEFTKAPIDLIFGSKDLRKKIENLEDIEKIEKSWRQDLKEYKQIKEKIHIYK